MKKQKNDGKRITQIIFTIAFIIILSQQVISLGILPASQSVLIGKDSQQFAFYIDDDNKEAELELRVEGVLADFVEIDRPKITMTKNKEREQVNVKIKDLPEYVAPGEHIVRVIVTESGSAGSQITARLSISYRITITVPYDEAFLDVMLFAPNFDRDKGGNFVIQAQNKGTINAVDVVPIIDIYSATNHKIATLRGESRLIRSGESVNFALPLTEELQNGKYLARASLVYSGKSNTDDKTFTVGSPEIKIDDISTSTFRLGGIAGFDIFLRNNWGEELGVFADVEFKRDNQLLERTTTATTRIDPMARSRLQAFWDTSGLSAGVYDMIIILNYLDKKDSTIRQIRLEADRVSVIGTGQVIAERERSDSLMLLIFVIFVLVLLNAFFVYKFVIKKKTGDEKQ